MKYYYEPENRIIETEELIRKYGSSTNIPQLGMYKLTEQPDYSVAGYVKEGNAYKPIRDYSTELEQANATIETMRTDYEARIAALEAL